MADGLGWGDDKESYVVEEYPPLARGGGSNERKGV